MTLSQNDLLKQTGLTYEPAPGIVVQQPKAAAAVVFAGGVVNADGTIAAGSGFAATRTGAGVYVVTFSPSFLALPAVVCQRLNTYGFTAIVAIAATGFTINMETTAGVAADEEWSFVALAAA